MPVILFFVFPFGHFFRVVFFIVSIGSLAIGCSSVAIGCSSVAIIFDNVFKEASGDAEIGTSVKTFEIGLCVFTVFTVIGTHNPVSAFMRIPFGHLFFRVVF